jgi:hypothetical protein
LDDIEVRGVKPNVIEQAGIHHHGGPLGDDDRGVRYSHDGASPHINRSGWVGAIESALARTDNLDCGAEWQPGNVITRTGPAGGQREKRIR